MTEASIDIPTDAPVVFSFPSRKPKALVERPSFDMPAAVAVAHSTANVRREARVPEINAKKPARHSNFASLESGIDTNVDRIRFDTPSLAPLAFMRFCVHYPQDCNDRLSPGAEPVDLTDARKAELSSINREVNREIRPQENFDGLAAEQWLVSPREGDCNDYAVTKRHKLLARGWPSRSLLLAEVIVPSGEHHLVLIVRTREADLVLDNLNWNVRPVSKIRYRWVRAQQEKNPKIWSTISVTRAARIAMNER
jgi:predicted transglutaminase-like cysteine proteinase